MEDDELAPQHTQGAHACAYGHTYTFSLIPVGSYHSLGSINVQCLYYNDYVYDVTVYLASVLK